MNYGKAIKKILNGKPIIELTESQKFRIKLEIAHNIAVYDESDKDFNIVCEDMFRIFGIEPP